MMHLSGFASYFGMFSTRLPCAMMQGRLALYGNLYWKKVSMSHPYVEQGLFVLRNQ